MNSVIGGLFVSGRSTARSIVMPRTTMIAKVMTKATANGTPRSTRLTNVSAANRRSAPCEKFKTPDVL